MDNLVIKTLRWTRHTCLLSCELILEKCITRTWKIISHAIQAKIYLIQTHSAMRSGPWRDDQRVNIKTVTKFYEPGVR